MVKDLRDYGRVKRPQLGITVRDYALQTRMPSDLGVYVVEVFAGSPAEAGGLKEGDVIVKVAGREVNYSAQLFDSLLNYYPGERIDITVNRGGTPVTVTVELGDTK